LIVFRHDSSRALTLPAISMEFCKWFNYSKLFEVVEVFQFTNESARI